MKYLLDTNVLSDARRRSCPGLNAHLRTWLETDISAVFAGTTLPVEERIARHAARLHVPDPMPEMDALIAATAQVYDLTLVTRNTGDFRRAGVQLLDPWEL